MKGRRECGLIKEEMESKDKFKINVDIESSGTNKEADAHRAASQLCRPTLPQS
jgi:hypothetical protein